MSDSLRPHELQQARLPCPWPSPGVCSNSCPLSRWYLPTISSSVAPFSSCLQSFPASESFPMSWLFALRGHSISFSIIPFSEYSVLISLGLTGLILLPKGLSRVFFSTRVQNYQFLSTQPSHSNSHICTWLPEKP